MRTEEQARLLLEELGRMQEDGRAVGLPCPRCGYPLMDPILDHNSLSRRARVYICPQCGMDEAMLDMAGMPPRPLNEWGMVRGFDTDDGEEDADDEE